MSDRLNLIDTIAKEDKFSTFTRLMRTSKTNDVFDTDGPFTVFVPTNDAFAKLPDHTMNALLSETDQTRLRTLLSYHVLPGKVMAANLTSAMSRKALSGEELMFTDINGLKVNGASIQSRNLEASNGVVHALDTVLTPTRIPATAPSATYSPALSAVPAAPADAIRPAPPTDKLPALSAVPATASPAQGTDTKTVL